MSLDGRTLQLFYHLYLRLSLERRQFDFHDSDVATLELCGSIAGAGHIAAASKKDRQACRLFHSLTLAIAVTTHLFLSREHRTGAPEAYLLALKASFSSQTILVFAWGQKLC